MADPLRDRLDTIRIYGVISQTQSECRTQACDTDSEIYALLIKNGATPDEAEALLQPEEAMSDLCQSNIREACLIMAADAMIKAVPDYGAGR